MSFIFTFHLFVQQVSQEDWLDSRNRTDWTWHCTYDYPEQLPWPAGLLSWLAPWSLWNDLVGLQGPLLWKSAWHSRCLNQANDQKLEPVWLGRKYQAHFGRSSCSHGLWVFGHEQMIEGHPNWGVNLVASGYATTARLVRDRPDFPNSNLSNRKWSSLPTRRRSLGQN